MAEEINIVELAKDTALKFLYKVTKLEEIVKDAENKGIIAVNAKEGWDVADMGIRMMVVTDILLDCIVKKEGKERALKEYRKALMSAATGEKEVIINEKRNECY